MAAVRPAWLEEPFAPAQVDAFAALRDKTTIPLAAGEPEPAGGAFALPRRPRRPVL